MSRRCAIAADLTGVDTELRVTQSMFEEMGETFRPGPLMKSMVAAAAPRLQVRARILPV